MSRTRRPYRRRRNVSLLSLLLFVLAVAVAAMVVIGMEGHGKDRAPELANRLARAARHLNGDAEPPKRFQHLFR